MKRISTLILVFVLALLMACLMPAQVFADSLPDYISDVKVYIGDGVIITQQYYCADYDSDKAVDAFDLFCLDKYLNGLA